MENNVIFFLFVWGDKHLHISIENSVNRSLKISKYSFSIYVLLVYKQLALQFDEKGQLIPFKENEQVVHVLSYDEKPGIQAIANTSEDLSLDKITKLLVVITNTSVLELFLCLPELIYRQEKQFHL